MNKNLKISYDWSVMLVILYLLTTALAFLNAFLFLLYSMIRVKVKNRIVLNIVSWPMACYVCSVFWQPMCIRKYLGENCDYNDFIGFLIYVIVFAVVFYLKRIDKEISKWNNLI